MAKYTVRIRIAEGEHHDATYTIEASNKQEAKTKGRKLWLLEHGTAGPYLIREFGVNYEVTRT